MPMTTATLIQIGAKKTDDIIQAPNWPLIVALLFTMLAVVGATLFLIYYFQTRKWESQKRVVPKCVLPLAAHSDRAHAHTRLFRRAGALGH